ERRARREKAGVGMVELNVLADRLQQDGKQRGEIDQVHEAVVDVQEVGEVEVGGAIGQPSAGTMALDGGVERRSHAMGEALGNDSGKMEVTLTFELDLLFNVHRWPLTVKVLGNSTVARRYVESGFELFRKRRCPGAGRFAPGRLRQRPGPIKKRHCDFEQ